MKRKIFTLFQVIATVAMLFTANSCSDLTNNPLQDKETGEDITLLLLDPNFFDTKVILRFEDFDTGEILTGTEITAALKGDMASFFVNLFGEKKEVYKTSSGIMELYLDPSITPEENPMELEAVAVGEPLWLASPTSFDITESGERTIVVRMIDWSKSADLKSASAINNVSIRVVGEPSLEDTKVKALNYQSRDYFLVDQYLAKAYSFNLITSDPLMCSYFGIGCESVAETTLWFLAQSISGIDEKVLDFWGFKENLSTAILLKTGQTTTTAYKKKGVSKCSDGLKVKINAPELSDADLTSSSSFKYTITFSDETTKTGVVSGSFKNLSTKGNKVEPIYYPTDDAQVTVKLEENSQFYFEQPSQTLDSPCGEVTFVAKKKQNLVNYNFSVTYTCSVAGLTYSGTGLFKNTTKGTEAETFSLSVGGFSLNLLQGDSYQLSVIIDNEAYSLNIDTKDIKGSLLGQSVDGNKVTNVSVSGNDASGYNVSITVELTADLCGKITGQ